MPRPHLKLKLRKRPRTDLNPSGFVSEPANYAYNQTRSTGNKSMYVSKILLVPNAVILYIEAKRRFKDVAQNMLMCAVY